MLILDRSVIKVGPMGWSPRINLKSILDRSKGTNLELVSIQGRLVVDLGPNLDLVSIQDRLVIETFWGRSWVGLGSMWLGRLIKSTPGVQSGAAAS